MTLLDRDLVREDIKVVVTRNPVRLVVAADAGDAILVEQGSSYETRKEADLIREIMNQVRPDNTYALGPSTTGPEIIGGKFAPDFQFGRTSVWAGPLKASSTNTGMFRKIMEAMR